MESTVGLQSNGDEAAHTCTHSDTQMQNLHVRHEQTHNVRSESLIHSLTG